MNTSSNSISGQINHPITFIIKIAPLFVRISFRIIAHNQSFNNNNKNKSSIIFIQKTLNQPTSCLRSRRLTTCLTGALDAVRSHRLCRPAPRSTAVRRAALFVLQESFQFILSEFAQRSDSLAFMVYIWEVSLYL